MSPQFDPSVGDNETLKAVLNAAEERIAARESDREEYNRLYPDVEGYKSPIKVWSPSTPRDVKPPSNLQDGGTGVSATTGGTGFAAGTYGGKRAADKMFDNKSSGLGDKIFARKAEKIKTGNFQDLKELAKKQNIDTNKFRGNEAGLRKELDKRLKKEVAAKLKKLGIEERIYHTGKKGIVSLVAGAASGGVGFVGGSLLYDIISLAEDGERSKNGNL